MIKSAFLSALYVSLLLTTALQSQSQSPGLFPQFTKWYQDPLGFKPLQLSTAFGFVWGSTAAAASLLFTKNYPEIRKKVTIFGETALGSGYKPPHTQMSATACGLLFSVRKWMGTGIEWTAFHFKDNLNNTWSFGFRPFARWYALNTEKLKLYFEYGGGICYSLNRFPLTGTGLEADTARTGTKFNLNSKYGTGLQWQISKHTSLQSGIRHFHLSNGNIKGIQRNPSYDCNIVFLGILRQL